ncbi:MAG TPA: primosomal protein N' [Candidatus Udaeobacter sp.]|nr:primosomal protein N' [Candidatus Udaeobacter sp.]
MIIQVIPARRMPLSLPVLDYLVSEENENKIKIGQLIKIPFRNKEEFGVIFKIKNDESPAKLKLKNIKEIALAEPILSEQQLNFLQDVSQFYHVSLGFLLKTNLLPLQIRKLKKITDISKPQKTVSKINQSKPQIFIHKNEAEKKDFILEKLEEEKSQHLILVPELSGIKKTMDFLPENVLSKTIIITSELNTKELFAAWLQIWTGEKNIIVGTRAALFLPWFDLKNIILTDEGNSNYKSWDMAPRLHTRDAALFLSKHHNAALSILSHTPAIESYYFAKNKVYDTDNDLKIKPLNKTTEIIDMKSEKRGGNYSLVSIDTMEELKKTKTGDIVFFLNRRGSASYVGCQDCGNVLKCPNCKLALTYHQDKKTLVCHYCNFSENLPTICQKCQGVNISTLGAGTQLAEELIKKITAKLSDPRPVIRIDSDENELEKLNIDTDTGSGAGKIIICTQLAWPYLNWEKIELFVFLDADTALFIPEYKTIENFWQQIRDAQYKLSSETKLLIQTKHPEHLVFASLYAPDNFYTQQLSERRAFGYPPFKYILKLLAGNQKSNVVEKEAREVLTKLQTLTKGNSGIKILGPLETSPYYHNGQYWQVILAKIGYENYKKSTKLLLAQVPESWKIDPNPNSLLYFY